MVTFEDVKDDFSITIVKTDGTKKIFKRKEPLDYTTMQKYLKENAKFVDKINDAKEDGEFPQGEANAQFLGLIYGVNKKEFIDGVSFALTQKVVDWLKEKFFSTEAIKVKKG